MKIRDAVAADAASACTVLRRSITELCVADHGNDQKLLSPWLSNKTVETFRSWLRPGNSVLVAVEGDNILAVGAVNDSGKVTLNYVSPDARFRGVSRTLISALEARAAERGNRQCKLNSTATARRFYKANGYVDDGEPVNLLGLIGYPMSKSLTAEQAVNQPPATPRS